MWPLLFPKNWTPGCLVEDEGSVPRNQTVNGLCKICFIRHNSYSHGFRSKNSTTTTFELNDCLLALIRSNFIFFPLEKRITQHCKCKENYFLLSGTKSNVAYNFQISNIMRSGDRGKVKKTSEKWRHL